MLIITCYRYVWTANFIEYGIKGIKFFGLLVGTLVLEVCAASLLLILVQLVCHRNYDKEQNHYAKKRKEK